MSRLSAFLLLLIAATLTAGASVASAASAARAAPAPPRKPNVILFLIDDQDKASLGAYGGKTYTPSLDRMAAEGMKFTHAYPKEQIAAIQRAAPADLPRAMSYIGRLGIGVRGAERAGFWDEDQLYDLRNDPDERVNLAADRRHAEQLARMRQMLTDELRRGTRPFGEFVPGGNAAPAGQIARQIALVKTLTILGKTVLVPGEDDAREPIDASRKDQRKADRKSKKSKP